MCYKVLLVIKTCFENIIRRKLFKQNSFGLMMSKVFFADSTSYQNKLTYSLNNGHVKNFENCNIKVLKSDCFTV